jgi:hypothetical protein
VSAAVDRVMCSRSCSGYRWWAVTANVLSPGVAAAIPIKSRLGSEARQQRDLRVVKGNDF